LCLILLYGFLFFCLGTNNTVKAKQDLESYLSQGYTLYLDGKEVTYSVEEDGDALYLLAKDYSYTVNGRQKMIILEKKK
jgi:hypothetical protein